MEYSLSGQAWELKGFWPWVPLKGTSMEIGNVLMGVTEWVPATVPGGVHYDLYREGLIDHPYRDLNSIHCEWIENRWWVYRTQLKPPFPEGVSLDLVFKGLDYEALIYLNGELLGEHKGMYHPASFDVTGILRHDADNELLVVLKHAPDEMGQIGKTSETFTQKSRFNYKWDFSTRLVNIGIWDDVVLRANQAYSFDDIALHTDYDGDKGLIRLSASYRSHGTNESDGPELEVIVSDPDGVTIAAAAPAAGEDGRWNQEIGVDSPMLWYPNGYGEQPLYTVKLLLKSGSSVCDERVLRTGIRRLEYRQNEGSPEGALPYTFVVNGKRIYIKGANVTPLDHLYGNITPDRYEWMVLLAKHANMNMLRVWGGGIIEKTLFYELCDRHGIMIWQEFIQSSSGIDNEPSKRPEFLSLLRQTAVHALRTRRNHVSLTVWSGGNELMSEQNKPSTFEDANLSMLRDLVRQYDPQRLCLPTSASGPVQYVTEEPGVGHDVHGHWKYQGNPDHYRIYGVNDYLFHSEFGVDGVSSPRSLAKFLSPEHRKPVSMRDNLVWRHHGEWWDTYDRDTELFGDMPDLATFSRCSQWMQAEGLRFILEANRRRQFRQSGSLIWQLNEPWPNVTCTNLVDYYEETKMAYYWVRQAFAQLHVSLDYRKLDYKPGETFDVPVFVHADERDPQVQVHAEVLDAKGSVLYAQSFDVPTMPERAVEAGRIVFEIPHRLPYDLMFVRLTAASAAGASASNVYVFSTAVEGPVYRQALGIDAQQLEVSPLTEWQTGTGIGSESLERVYSVENRGQAAALFIVPVEATDNYRMTASDAGFILFPGERKTVNVYCRLREPELFSRDAADRAQAGPPVILFDSFGRG